MDKKALIAIVAVGSLALSGGAVATANAASIPEKFTHGAKAVFGRGVRHASFQGTHPMMHDNIKLAALLNMTPTDLTTALKSGKTILQIATEHGVTQDQLNQFQAAQKQARLDSMKQKLAADVASGKITQAQMDQHLSAVTNHTVKPSMGFGRKGRHGTPVATPVNGT